MSFRMNGCIGSTFSELEVMITEVVNEIRGRCEGRAQDESSRAKIGHEQHNEPMCENGQCGAESTISAQHSGAYSSWEWWSKGPQNEGN